MNAPIPSGFRRHRTLLLVSAGVVWLLVLLALLAWWLLPRWAPDFVIRYSPMPDMVFRAAIDGGGRDSDARKRLIAMGTRVTPVMIAHLQHSDEMARSLALLVLGGVKDPQATEAVLAVLLDPRESLHGLAIQALGEIGDARVMPHLLPFLSHKTLDFVAAFALRGLPDTIVADALRPLMLQHPSVPILTALTTNRDPRVPGWLDEVLRTSGPGLEQFKQHALPTNENSRAALALAQNPQPSATALLLQALHDPSPEIRDCAVIGLGWLGSRMRTKPELQTAVLSLLQDPDVRVLTRAVGYCSDKKLGEAHLYALLDDPDPQRRAAAAHAYTWSFHFSLATEKLLRLAKDPDEDVRVAVVGALGRIPQGSNPQILAALLTALYDASRMVRCTGINALQHKSHDVTITAALVDLLVRSLEPLDPPLVTGVITALGDQPLSPEHQRVIADAKIRVGYVTPPSTQMIPPACVLRDP